MERSDPVSRFLSAFSEIEHHLKSRLQTDEGSLQDLIVMYAEKFGMTRQDQNALRIFRQLRNLLIHNRYQAGTPIAIPSGDVVIGIEKVRDRIVHPPTVLGTLPRREVVSFTPNDALVEVLDEVRKEGYSQFPIYEGRTYRGLLTTNCITRWLAERLATVGLVETETVEAVMRFAEPQDHAAHVPRTVTALRAIERLSPPENGGPPPAALIVTESGKPDENPLAIVVAEDIGVLFNALHS